MNNKTFLFAVVLCTQLISVDVSASTVDWSTTSLSGSFPNYSFSDPTLGTVSLSYSNDAQLYGIINYFAQNTLGLGLDEGVSLTISWSNPITNMNMQLWDIDGLGGGSIESVSVASAAAVTPVSLATDLWDAGTQTLSGDGTVDDNANPNNYSVLNFSDPGGFSSITLNWHTPDPGGAGVGQLSEISTVPVPPSVVLLLSGLLGMLLVAAHPSRCAGKMTIV